jgi:hypothetical protein
MKEAAVKAKATLDMPIAANGNSWETKHKTACLRSVLREWSEGSYEFTAANDAE